MFHELTLGHTRRIVALTPPDQTAITSDQTRSPFSRHLNRRSPVNADPTLGDTSSEGDILEDLLNPHAHRDPGKSPPQSGRKGKLGDPRSQVGPDPRLGIAVRPTVERPSAGPLVVQVEEYCAGKLDPRTGRNTPTVYQGGCQDLIDLGKLAGRPESQLEPSSRVDRLSVEPGADPVLDADREGTHDTAQLPDCSRHPRAFFRALADQLVE